MSRLNKIKSKLNSMSGRGLPPDLKRRVGLGIVLIILTNGASMAPNPFMWAFLVTLVVLTPVLMVLDYIDLWRDFEHNDIGPLSILGKGDYQSMLAVVFSLQTLLILGFPESPAVGMAISWVVALLTGFIFYPLILSAVLLATSNITFKTTPVQIEFEKSADTIANIYLNRDWIIFNEPLTSIMDDIQFDDYSLVRIPVGDKSDISFMTQLPPDLDTETDQFSRELFQHTHTSPIPSACEVCNEDDKDTYIRVAKRQKWFWVFYKVNSAYLCESCMKRSVIDVAESDKIRDLSKADLIAQEI